LNPPYSLTPLGSSNEAETTLPGGLMDPPLLDPATNTTPTHII
jgi:hypothetical protein